MTIVSFSQVPQVYLHCFQQQIEGIKQISFLVAGDVALASPTCLLAEFKSSKRRYMKYCRYPFILPPVRGRSLDRSSVLRSYCT
jgi:hypothetical protein